MTIDSRHFTPIPVGDNVMVNVPELDRGRGDDKNILCIVISESEGFFQIGTKHGKLEHQYNTNQLISCDEKFKNAAIYLHSSLSR